MKTNLQSKPTMEQEIGREAEAPEPATPANDERPAWMRRRPKPIHVLGALAVVAVAGYAIYQLVTAGQEETDDAQVEADVVPVGPRVPGQILRVAVVENQAVKKGDLVLELDAADYQARLAQAQAELATAQAQATSAEAQERIVGATATGGLASAEAAFSASSVAVSNADAQVEAAQAAVARAEADARKADLDLKRAQQLIAAHAVTQQMVDNAQAAADAAHAALSQARANLAAAQEARRAAVSRVAEAKGKLQQSSPVGAQIAAAHAAAELARAKVKSAEAAARLADLQLSYTRVTAPEDGTVSKLGAHDGQIVQAGQPVVELVPSRTYVIANFKETQIGGMKPGDRVKIKIDAYPGKTFHGKVESRSGGTGARFALIPPDNASGNFVKVVQRVPIRIAWTTSPDVPLAAGLSADVTVYTK
jgi:membrane fusion protein (multidrug efflux system)